MKRLPLLVLGLAALAVACQAPGGAPAIAPPEPHVHPDLAAHQARHAEPRLVAVSEHVYAALDFDMANIAFIVGDGGVVVFDTGWQVANGRAALAALREVTDAPIVAVVYSHGHYDHTGGVRAFVASGREDAIPIYANRRWRRYMRELAVPRAILRGAYQVGAVLPVGAQGTVGSGIGPTVRVRGDFSYLAPTVEVDDRLEVTIAGVRIVLMHAPGDLDDGLAAWLPDERVLLAGDSFYPALPLIGTPRFEQGRQAWEALHTFERYRELDIEHLVPGHLDVVSGRQEVQRKLERFRDALEFMYDQTIRLVNQNLDHAEVARRIAASLPAHLANDPDLAVRYHELRWMLKTQYTKSAGWWGGDVVDLIAVSPSERAARMVALAGGRAAVHAAVVSAYASGDRAWAAELARALTLTDPDDAFARAQLASILRAVAYDSTTANQRHYLLSEALVLEGRVDPSAFPTAIHPDLLRVSPDAVLFRALGTRLDPARCLDAEFVAGFSLPDGRPGEQEHTVIVRRGVLEYRAGRPDEADLRVALGRETWLLVAGGLLPWRGGLASGQIQVEPNAAALDRFASFFDPLRPPRPPPPRRPEAAGANTLVGATAAAAAPPRSSRSR